MNAASMTGQPLAEGHVILISELHFQSFGPLSKKTSTFPYTFPGADPIGGGSNPPEGRQYKILLFFLKKLHETENILSPIIKAVILKRANRFLNTVGSISIKSQKNMVNSLQNKKPFR